MKKILLLIIIIISALIIYLLFIFFSMNGKNYIPIFLPTPTPIRVQPTVGIQSTLYVIDTQPKGTATDAPIDQPISITFNKDISDSDFTFTIKPNFEYSTKIQGQTFIVTPKNPLQERVTYEYFIDYKNGQHPDIHFFTTAGQGPMFPNSKSNFRSLIDNSDIKYAPDVYVSNKIEDNPNPNPDFSAAYDYTSAPEGHYFFTVTANISNKDQVKQEFIDWLKSLGLNDQQIQSLDVRYQ